MPPLESQASWQQSFRYNWIPGVQTLPERGELPMAPCALSPLKAAASALQSEADDTEGQAAAIQLLIDHLPSRDEEQEQAHPIAGFGAIGIIHSASLDAASSPNR